MSDDGTGLPASFEAAWGLRGRPSRGPKPSLSLERIVAAGIAVASTEGLAAVSMSRVAAEAGASTMALYRYVGSKDELLALMVDTAFGPPPANLAEPDGNWREGLSRWAWAELQAVLRHPWGLRVPITGPPVTPNQIAWLERGLRFLGSTKLAETEKLSTIMLLSGYVLRWATLAADLGHVPAAEGSAEGEAGPADGLDEGVAQWLALTKVIDPDRFPAVTAVLAAEMAGEGPEDFLDEFVFGLERVLDGIQTLVDRRGGRRHSTGRKRRSGRPVVP
jgi:AcrR family transcriptional regulator